MAGASIGTPGQLRDPNDTPPLVKAVPLGIQHVLAMFVSNVTPAIIVCGAADFGFGFGSNSPDFPQMIYMIQMSMFFAGVATLIQTIGIGPVGVLPNTSFSQNVGLIAMTRVMSSHVVTIGTVFLIVAGVIPKVGAVISTIPIEALGGGVMVMFGIVVAAGISMLSDVHWNRRNMVIFAIALSLGLGGNPRQRRSPRGGRRAVSRQPLRRLFQRRPRDRPAGAVRAPGVVRHPPDERGQERVVLRAVRDIRGEVRRGRDRGLAESGAKASRLIPEAGIWRGAAHHMKVSRAAPKTRGSGFGRDALMMVVAVLGGYAGARVAKAIPVSVVRAIVDAIG